MLDPPDIEDLMQQLARTQAETTSPEFIDQVERLQDLHFVAAMLTLRIRYRQRAAAASARADPHLQFGALALVDGPGLRRG